MRSTKTKIEAIIVRRFAEQKAREKLLKKMRKQTSDWAIEALNVGNRQIVPIDVLIQRKQR